jgi:hypothetical protein
MTSGRPLSATEATQQSKKLPDHGVFQHHDLFTTVDSLTRNTGMIEGKAF